MNGLKEAFSRENLLKNLNFFALLNLGLVLTAVGIVYFKNPNHFAFGGTSGLSILLADLFPRINAGRNTANTRSSMASPLRDAPEGYSHSQQDTKKESAKEE